MDSSSKSRFCVRDKPIPMGEAGMKDPVPVWDSAYFSELVRADFGLYEQPDV